MTSTIEIALWHEFSPVNLLHIFRAPFLKSTYGRHTIKPGTPEHGTTEHRTPEHWQNIQPNTGRSIGIPQNSGTCEEQRNNVTTKQHQEILPIQTDDILNR